MGNRVSLRAETTMDEREPLAWDFPLPRIHTGVSLGNVVQGVLV